MVSKVFPKKAQVMPGFFGIYSNRGVAMTFLIQTHNGRIIDDHSFTLIAAVEYHTWKNPQGDMRYTLIDSLPEHPEAN